MDFISLGEILVRKRCAKTQKLCNENSMQLNRLPRIRFAFRHKSRQQLKTFQTQNEIIKMS